MTHDDSRAVALTTIVSTLNHEIQVAQSLRSIAAQTRRAADVVVVDRGSSDATIAVARENHAGVLRLDGASLARARDAAIAATRQPWVAIVECGAVWHSSLLSRIEPLLELSPNAEMIVCAYETVEAAPLSTRRRTVRGAPRFPTIFLKRSLWESAGTFERARLLAASRRSVMAIDDPLVRVRQVEGRIRRRLRLWTANTRLGRARSRLAFPIAIPPRSPANHCLRPRAADVFKESFSARTAGRKRVALTFDDGPNASTTARILEILQQTNVRGTFFLLGNRLRREPALGALLAEAGMEIANHTMTHPQLTLFETAAQAREISEGVAVIEKLCGTSCRYFRPPYGLFDGNTLEAASRSGQTTVLWNIDSEDWSGIEPREIARRSLACEEYPAVVLLHDGLQSTVEALPAIIQGYRQAGFEFGTVSEVLSEVSFAR